MENTRVRGGNSLPKTNRKVKHRNRFRNELSSACKSCQMMTSVAVVLLYADSIGFSDNVAFWRQNFRKSTPSVSEKEAVPAMLDFFVKSAKSCRITITQHPSDRSACATVNRLFQSYLVFLTR